MGGDWRRGLRGLCLRSRGFDWTSGNVCALGLSLSELLANVVLNGDDDADADMLRGLRAGCASSPCLTLDSESSGIKARSDKGRGARMASPVIALWILNLPTALGIFGFIAN